jgi:hypothetical protein
MKERLDEPIVSVEDKKPAKPAECIMASEPAADLALGRAATSIDRGCLALVAHRVKASWERQVAAGGNNRLARIAGAMV